MENSRENQARPSGLLWAAVCLVLGISVYYSPLFVLTMAVLPALWAAMAFRTRPYLLAVCAAGVFLFGCAMGYGVKNSLCVTLLAAPGGILLWVLQRERMGNAASVLSLAVALAFGLFCVFCVPDLVDTGDAYVSIRAYFADMPQVFAGTALEQSARYLLNNIESYMVAAFYMFAGGYALVNVLLLHRMNRQQDMPLCPMAPFGSWSLPYGYALATGLGSLLTSLMATVWDNPALTGLSLLLYEMWALPLMLTGMSFLYRLVNRRRQRPMQVAVYVLLVGVATALLQQIAQMGLLLLGFSQVVLRRRRGKERPL